MNLSKLKSEAARATTDASVYVPTKGCYDLSMGRVAASEREAVRRKVYHAAARVSWATRRVVNNVAERMMQDLADGVRREP